MYATYTYKAGSTAANILADVILMLTGTTDPLLLSGDCVVGSTTITATEAAGWTVFDAAAGTNAQCVRAPISDDAAQFKYVVVDTNTAGYIFIKLYESWNAVAHTGTNICQRATDTDKQQRLNVTAGGRLDIRATERVIAMFSLQGGVYGSVTGTSWNAVVERTRLGAWDTVAAGYPKAVQLLGASLASSTYVYASAPRLPGAGGEDTTGSTCYFQSLVTCYGAVLGGVRGYDTSQGTFIPDATKTPVPPLIECAFSYETTNNFGGVFSDLCKIYLTTYNYGSVYDTIALGADTYIVWTAGAWRWAIKVA